MDSAPIDAKCLYDSDWDADFLSEKGAQLLLEGKPTEAEILFQRALAMNETSFGVGHILSVTSVVDCSKALQAQGKYEEAFAFVRLELTRAEKVVGQESVSLAPLLADIASLHEHFKRNDKAVKYRKRELALRRRETNCYGLVRCLYTLGSLLFNQGQEQEGIVRCQEAESVAEHQLGTDHVECISARYYLANCFMMQQKYPNAAALLRQGLSSIHRKKIHHPLISEIVTQAKLARELVHMPNQPFTEADITVLASERTSCDAIREENTLIMKSPSISISSKFGGSANTVESRPSNSNSGFLTTEGRAVRPSKKAQYPIGEGPLPAGWLMKVHPSGRPFFVDTNTKRTTWVDPRLKLGHDDALPDGWELGFDKYGAVYYIDHVNKRTQRDRPTTAACGTDSACIDLSGQDSSSNSTSTEKQPVLIRRPSVGSLASWGSLQSIISGISESVSSVSSSTFLSAKALLVGGESKEATTQQAATISHDRQGILPKIVNKFRFSVSSEAEEDEVPKYEQRV